MVTEGMCGSSDISEPGAPTPAILLWNVFAFAKEEKSFNETKKCNLRGKP